MPALGTAMESPHSERLDVHEIEWKVGSRIGRGLGM